MKVESNRELKSQFTEIFQFITEILARYEKEARGAEKQLTGLKARQDATPNQTAQLKRKFLALENFIFFLTQL